MSKEQDELLRIEKLRVERESLVQDIRAVAIMGDEGMSGDEGFVHAMEKRLAQIDLELKVLTTKRSPIS